MDSNKRHTRFLFDPDHVKSLFEALPHLGADQNPQREGEKAEWFPGLRKSPRQLYRLLGNTHYDHLALLLERLDTCTSVGFRQPRLLRTRVRSSFAPDLAELRVADHFVLSGCSITSFDETKGDESVTDFVAEDREFRVAVEVYCPPAWKHLDDFESEAMAVVKNVDMPLDFKFQLAFKKINDFTADGHAAFLHPGVLDEALGSGRSAEIIKWMENELQDRLNNPPEQFEIERDEPDMNVRIRLALQGIVSNQDKLPDRCGCISGLERSGYRPEHLFEHIVEKAIAKAQKGQALTVQGVDAAVLVVDLAEADLFSELRNDVYCNKIFDPLFQSKIGKDRYGHTAIIFCDSADWGQPFVVRFGSYSNGASKALLDLLEPHRMPSSSFPELS